MSLCRLVVIFLIYTILYITTRRVRLSLPFVPDTHTVYVPLYTLADTFVSTAGYIIYILSNDEFRRQSCNYLVEPATIYLLLYTGEQSIAELWLPAYF